MNSTTTSASRSCVWRRAHYPVRWSVPPNSGALARLTQGLERGIIDEDNDKVAFGAGYAQRWHRLSVTGNRLSDMVLARTTLSRARRATQHRQASSSCVRASTASRLSSVIDVTTGWARAQHCHHYDQQTSRVPSWGNTSVEPCAIATSSGS